MPQTFGSQYFGPLYDVIGWLLLAGMFFGYAIMADHLSPKTRELLSPFLFSKSTCVLIGVAMLALAGGKYLGMW